jgi:hypothetical protein
MDGTGGADGRRLLVMVGLVSGVILLGSLAAVGLLPGQATTLPEPVTASATTTIPGGAVTSARPTTTSVLTTTTSPTTTTDPAAESATAPTTSPEAAPRAGSSQGQGQDPVATPAPDTTAAPSGGATDPTCEALQELLASIEDATVRALISNEFSSVCAG